MVVAPDQSFVLERAYFVGNKIWVEGPNVGEFRSNRPTFREIKLRKLRTKLWPRVSRARLLGGVHVSTGGVLHETWLRWDGKGQVSKLSLGPSRGVK